MIYDFSSLFIYSFISDCKKLHLDRDITFIYIYNQHVRGAPVVELRMLGIVFICVAARYHLIFIRRTTISSIPWKLFNSPTYKLAWKSGENLVKNIEMFLPYNESTKTSCTSVLYIIIYTQSKEYNKQVPSLPGPYPGTLGGICSWGPYSGKSGTSGGG